MAANKVILVGSLKSLFNTMVPPLHCADALKPIKTPNVEGSQSRYFILLNGTEANMSKNGELDNIPWQTTLTELVQA